MDEIEKSGGQDPRPLPGRSRVPEGPQRGRADAKTLRQLVARQLLVLTYVDERLGPRVFVGPDDINRYYRSVLTPEMQKPGHSRCRPSRTCGRTSARS